MGRRQKAVLQRLPPMGLGTSVGDGVGIEATCTASWTMPSAMPESLAARRMSAGSLGPDGAQAYILVAYIVMACMVMARLGLRWGAAPAGRRVWRGAVSWR